MADTSLAKKTGIFFVILVIAGIAFFCWKMERWVNWKFSYGDKVETRIEQLESRVATLESGG